MDIEIFKLSKQADKKRLVEYLDQQSKEEFTQLVCHKLNDYHASNDVDTLLLLRALIQGSPIDGGQSCIQRRSMLLQCIIEWLSDEERESPEKSKQASLVVNLILPEIESLPTWILRDAARTITHAIQQKKVQLRLLDIFVKIWNILAAAEKVIELSDLFDRLLEAEWHDYLVVGMASALNDMELSNPQLEAVLRYMIKKLPQIEVEEVPPFIYQLLLISRKGYKRLILTGILDFFNTHQTSQVESTVMLHLSFALKQDQDLGNELIKLIKTNKSSQFEVFNMACLFTAARIHRLQDPIFDLFKTNIMSVYKDSEKLERCYWISDYSSLEADRFGQVLLEVTERSAVSGWDQVIQSLTQLSLILVDTATSIGSFFQTNTIKTRSQTKEHTSMEKVAHLGTLILLRLFKYHGVVQSEILEQITSRIVSRSSSTLHFLDLLASIIRDYPDTVERYLTNIKDTLDFLSYLPLSTAERLLHAIQPISKTNEHFRDGLILVLRKSLFAKDLDGRAMAVRGFLNILDQQLTESGESSVAQGVAFEVLGLLRRCFSQQYEIRLCAYHGLGSLSQQHPTCAGDIFDLFYTQFMRTYEKDTSIINPIKLDVCVENANNGGYPKMVEPIHLLLANLIKALRVASTQDTTSVTAETMDRFRDVMLSFVDRLSNAKLEDFELDKTVSFDMATHLGRRNNLYAHLVLGVYEICIEYVFMTHGMTAQSTETLLSLFKKRKSLFNVLKDSSTNEKGKKNTQLVISSCVSLEFTSKLFQAVFTQDKTDVVRDLRSDIDFAHFIITSTFDSLKFAIDDVYCHQDDKHFENSIMTCQTYLSILIHEDSDSTFANQQATKKTPSVLSSIAIALRGTLDMVSHVWPERFIEFLRRILNNHTQTTTSTNKVILQLIMQLKDIVLKYLSGRTPIYREASHVMHVCSFLCNKFEKKDTDFSVQSRVVVNWLSELAKERPLEDTGLTKDIIGLLIQLCANMGEFDTILSLSEDVHLFTGDLEVHHTDDDQPLKYSIINTKTFAVITSRLFEFLDASFDDLTWCIGRLKICASEDDQEVSHQFETEVCKRLVLLIFITSELVKSVLTDIHAESLFKTLAKTYKTLHTLVKYKIQFPQDISSQFIQVISKSGTEITDKMYKFLTVYGQSQHHDTGNQTKKNKGKQKQVNLKQKAKIQRETKMIPNLIFAVEQFERHLIQLSRKSKVDFMQYMKRSTSRDFKIQVDRMQADEDSDEEEEKGQEEEEEEENLKRTASSYEDEEQSHAGESSSKRTRIY